jgi:ABC-type multidrug transport system ATPase subunit/pSer/pThr/pTyr-binding forkhead associated (FHA) protein
MKITLAEKAPDGSPKGEVSFDMPAVLIGRDVAECDLVFDKDLFPMVSRHHAEMRLVEGRWLLSDLNSSYGTFLNGQRISGPAALSAGSQIQIGQSGPLLDVVSIEAVSASPSPFASPIAVEVVAGAGPVSSKERYVEAPRKAAAQYVSARLHFSSEPGRPPYTLSGLPVWVGRDPSCEIVFESTAAMVSRRHAEIRSENGNFLLADNNSFNGTLVNGQRISAVTPLYQDDEIQFGLGGPIVRFDSPGRPAPVGSSLAGQRSVSGTHVPRVDPSTPVSSKTMVFSRETEKPLDGTLPEREELLMSLTFGNKNELLIGRGPSNDIQLDGLQISNRHARLLRSGGETVIDDQGSTNGVFVNGSRVSRRSITPADTVQIGSFVIRVDGAGNVGVFDTRSRTRIDAVDLECTVGGRFGSRGITLVDSVSLSIAPNEFIGVLGTSGSGKSTLIDALNGNRPAKRGNVLINNLDLYRHFDSLKQSIGYVPQDDVIHRDLSVYKSLYYTARLRLSRDVSRSEVNQTINEVLDVTGLTERRDVRVSRLSGGQRKRVSIAVELITRPSVIFLDEPTSGLDPATAEKIMRLFRQIAESGRTVVMTTHAMENVRLFDKIVLLMRGRLVFYGTPEEALRHFQATSFRELYDKLEAPVDREAAETAAASRSDITERVADRWKQRFLATPEYRRYVADPLSELGKTQHAASRKKRRLGILGSIRQWLTLSKRYVEVLSKDKLNLLILFAQAPVIALLTFFVMGSDQPRDFVYFVLSIVAVWFGTSVAAREIIRERPVYRRERMVNLGILPYVGSKLTVIGLIVATQCFLLFVPLKLADLVRLMPMPGEMFGLPQLWTMLLTAAVGVALGLVVSALVRTSEMATSLVPLILIPQILFSGLVGVPSGLNKVIGLTMPAAWSFDTMKRFSTLDTLESEGADPNGKTGGVGLYKYIESENDKLIVDARKNIENYRKDAETKFREYDDQVQSGQTPALPHIDEPPAIPAPKKIPPDLSGYVSFLHPWMNEVLNQVVLMLMFGILVISTLLIIRIQDVG